MELKQIKELMIAMERSRIKKLTIKEKTGEELHLERHEEHHEKRPGGFVGEHYERHPIIYPQRPLESHVESAAPPSLPRGTHEEKTPSTQVEGKFITSPMVGTLYASSSPDTPPFVKVGDRVEENTVVCIVEAMKVMNEVKAGVSGVIAEIYIENAHPVEFGTKIFRVV